MDAVEEEKMDAAGEQQVAAVDEHQTTPEGYVQAPPKYKKKGAWCHKFW